MTTVKHALADAMRLERGGDFRAAEALYRGLLALAGSGAPIGSEALAVCHDRLVRSLYHQGRWRDAVEAMQQAWAALGGDTDEEFDAIYLEALRATRTPPYPVGRHARFYELVNELQRALHLEGSVAECGCFRGLSSYILCRYIQLVEPEFAGTGYHVFDSFEGLSPPSAEDEICDSDADATRLRRSLAPGAFAATLEEVRGALRTFPGVQFHPGWIPEAFAALAEERFRFVHVDVDLYRPTHGALEYFWPRLVDQAVMVCDDYNWPGARRAVDRFCSERGLVPEVTSYGQAVVVKR